MIAFRRSWHGAVLVAAPLLLMALARALPSQSGDIVDIGRGVYARECATCHGEAGTGYGPARLLLRQQPPDLTVFSSRTRPFDRESVRAVVTGRVRLEPSHVTTEMPLWRATLETPVPAAEGIVTELDALLMFLESIQRQPYGSPPITLETMAAAGAPLFKTYCVACHGEDGRGVLPPGYVVGVAAPDLTSIALRSGGEMNMRELFESIVGCSGDGSEMPGWGRRLTNAGWPRYLTMKNLEAVAWYVESLQQR